MSNTTATTGKDYKFNIIDIMNNLYIFLRLFAYIPICIIYHCTKFVCYNKCFVLCIVILPYKNYES